MQDFKSWVTSNSVYRMWLNSMIEEANAFVRGLDEKTRKAIKDRTATFSGLKDSTAFFEILNEIITTSSIVQHDGSGRDSDERFTGGLDGHRGKASRCSTTRYSTSNSGMSSNSWNTFLKSSASLDKLDIKDPEKEGSWISKAACTAGVWDQMVHDPKKPGIWF